MFIWLFNLIARCVPSTWKAQIKEISRAIVQEAIEDNLSRPAGSLRSTIREIVLDVLADALSPAAGCLPSTVAHAQVPSPSKIPDSYSSTLLAHYFDALDKLDPSNKDFSTQVKELKEIRSILKQKHRPQIVKMSPKSSRPAVSIIIPIYSNHESLTALLGDLENKVGFSQFEVIVVNDFPEQPLPEQLVNGAFPFSLTIIEHQWNAGFAAACNTGAGIARGEFLLFLNSDIRLIRNDLLENMLSIFHADPKVGVVGAKTLYPGGKLIEHFGMYPIWFKGSWKNSHYFHQMEDGIFPETQHDQKVDMVTGAALMIPADLFQELQGFDEGYFIGGYEDSDLCRSVRKLGYEIWVSAGAVLVHQKSASLNILRHNYDRLGLCHERYYNIKWSDLLFEMQSNGGFHFPFLKDSLKSRILYVVHGFPPKQLGGTEVYTFNLARSISEMNNFECVVFTRREYDGPEVFNGKFISEPKMTGKIPVFGCLRTGAEFSNVHPAAEFEFELLLNSIRPDIVHFNHTEHLSTNFVKIAKRQGVPVIYTLHEFLPICGNMGLLVMSDGSLCDGPQIIKCAACTGRSVEDVEKREALYRENFSCVDLFIAPSNFLKSRYIDWGIDPNQILHSRNGLPIFKRSDSKKEPNSKINFFYIGQITPHKGIAILLEAGELLHHRAKGRFELHIYGLFHNFLSSYKQEILNKVNSLGDFVFYHGRYENESLQTILKDADAVIVPSVWWENSPLTIQEAFIAGVPVITSNIGGMKELVQDGVQGLLFEVKNPADLADKMFSVIQNPSLLATFRKNLENEHIKTAEENASEMAELYGRLLKAVESQQQSV